MRAFFVCVFLSLLFFICIFDAVYVGKTFNSLLSVSTELHEEVHSNGLSKKAQDLCNDIDKIWENKKNALTVFIHHQETKILGDKIRFIVGLFSHNDEKKIKEEIHQLIYEIQTLKEQYNFNFVNLF